jgi:hypothetical protein
LRGPFGGCLIPKLCVTCVNYTRRQVVGGIYESSWENWALRNQRNLAQDEPLNWVMQIGTHNSFNSISYGHSRGFRIRSFLITDQLRAGARLMTLDLYQLLDATRLCHSFSPALAHEICVVPGDPAIYYPNLPSMRYYANGIKEIRNWLTSNPGEIVFIDLEDYTRVMGGTTADVLDPLNAYLGNLLVNPPLTSPPGKTQVRWPTRRELLADGRQVVVIDNHAANDGQDIPRVFSEETHLGPFNDGWSAKNLTPFYPNCTRMAFTADAGTDTFTFQTASQYASVKNDDRVVLKSALEFENSLPTGLASEGFTSIPYYIVNAGPSVADKKQYFSSLRARAAANRSHG